MYCSYLISLLSNQDKIESSLSMATAIYQDAGYSTSLLPEYSFLILFACARYFITALKISCLNLILIIMKRKGYEKSLQSVPASGADPANSWRH